MEILELLNTSLTTYFNTLKETGYIKDSEVNKLLIISCLYKLLSSEMRILVTEDDYRCIEKALYCLLGSSCLVPYQVFRGEDNLYGVDNTCDCIRVTENSIVRIDNSANERFAALNSYN